MQTYPLSLINMRGERWDLESADKPSRAQTFSRNNLLEMLMPRHPAAGSAMTIQQRIVTF
jgi:hypothetical protein